MSVLERLYTVGAVKMGQNFRNGGMNAAGCDLMRLRNTVDAVAFQPAAEPVLVDLLPDMTLARKLAATSGLMNTNALSIPITLARSVSRCASAGGIVPVSA
jgi:hypothetical protein